MQQSRTQAYPRSAPGTDRVCRPVRKHFYSWRLNGGAAPVPVLLGLGAQPI
jgi:hypothetical protein